MSKIFNKISIKIAKFSVEHHKYINHCRLYILSDFSKTIWTVDMCFSKGIYLNIGVYLNKQLFCECVKLFKVSHNIHYTSTLCMLFLFYAQSYWICFSKQRIIQSLFKKLMRYVRIQLQIIIFSQSICKFNYIFMPFLLVELRNCVMVFVGIFDEIWIIECHGVWIYKVY